MTSKERMLRALRREKPDRLPVTVHQWQPYHLVNYMGGMSALEAFRACSMDAALLFFPPYEMPQTPQWREVCTAERLNDKGEKVQEWTIETPRGSMSYSTTTNAMTTWMTVHPVKRDEDIYLIRDFMPLPRLRRAELEAEYEQLGDHGIMRGILPAFGYQGGSWQESVEWVGMEAMIMATYTKPEWVREFLDILTEKRLALIHDQLPGAKFDLVETGGGAASDTVISPDIFERYVIPCEQRIHSALRDAGFLSVYHTCGGMMRILDHIVQIGADASETLSPPGMGGNINEVDRDTVKQKLGSRLCLIGGMDQENVLNRASESGIRQEVQKLFRTFGEDGGYIMAPCDHFFNVERRRLEVFAQAAAECAY